MWRGRAPRLRGERHRRTQRSDGRAVRQSFTAKRPWYGQAVSGAEPPRPPRPPVPPPGAPRQPRRLGDEPVVERLPLEPPPEDRRWGNPWAAVVAGIVGVLSSVLIGRAVRNNKKTVTETERAGQPAVTQTVTQTKTVVQPKLEVHTTTVTAPTSTPSPANAESEARTREIEKNLRKVEKENEELKRQIEGRPTP